MKRTALFASVAVLLLATPVLAQGPRFATAPRGAVAPTPQVEAGWPARHQPVPARQLVHEPQARRFAAEAPDTLEPQGRAFGAGPGRNAGMAGLSDALDGVVAGALGLTQDELHALKQDGASIADIAAERGVAIDDLAAAYAEARGAAIAEQLAAGTINEQQAAQMGARGDAAFAELVAREGCAEGRQVTGEPLHANRADAARGAQAFAERQPLVDPQGPAHRPVRAPRGRW